MLISSARKLILGALALAASTIAASATPIPVTLASPGNLIDPSVTVGKTTINNVYIGPYTLNLNGVLTSAMCIDFNIDTPLNASWTANVTSVGSSDLSKTYSPSDRQEYEEEAYLFSKITAKGADQTGIQIAAWDIMYYGITSSSYTSQLSDNSYIDQALANYSSVNFNNFAIVSDTTIDGVQEFIVATPEPSSLVLSLAPALMMGVEAVRRKRQNVTA